MGAAQANANVDLMAWYVRLGLGSNKRLQRPRLLMLEPFSNTTETHSPITFHPQVHENSPGIALLFDKCLPDHRRLRRRHYQSLYALFQL